MASFRWSAVTVDCVDPLLVVAFWAELLNLEISEPLPGWRRLGRLGGPGPVITFQPVPEPKRGKARIHLDIAVDDIEQAVDAVTRSGGRSLGRRHDYDDGVVLEMADPEGNEFCLVQYASP